MDNADLQRTHGMATLAIMQAYEAAEARLTPEQIAEVHRRVEEGTAHLVLLVTNDGNAVHVELAVAPRDGPRFDNALLRVDGPVATLTAPSESVKVVDRNAMN